MEKRVGIAVCVTLLLIAILYARFGSIEDGRAGRFRRDTHTNREVVEHSREFENKEVIQVRVTITVQNQHMKSVRSFEITRYFIMLQGQNNISVKSK